MKKKIIIDVPCPVTMRNIVTGPRSIYRRLVEAGHDVVLLVPDYAAEAVRTEFGATVVPVTLKRSPTRAEKASDFITKHLTLTPMQVLGSKYGLRHNLDGNTRHGYLHVLRVMIANTLGKSRWFRLSVAPRMHLAAYKRRPLKSIFDEHKPDLVFVPNMVSVQGEEVLREVKRQGIPNMGMVGSWDHPHKRFQALQVDQIFVWSESIKKEMIELQSYDPKKIFVVGAPHFDHYLDPHFITPRDEYLSSIGLDPNKKLLTIFSGAGRAPDEADIVSMVMEASEEGKTVEPVQVYIRTYPGDEEGDMAKFGSFTHKPGVYVDWPGRGKHFGPIPLNYFPDEAYIRKFVSLFYHSASILSVYSSASVEASIFEKPSINIGFDGYKERPYEESVKRFVLQSHFDKLFSTGAVLDTHSEHELIEAVNTIFTNPNCRQQEIKKLQETVCGPLDGRASERIAAHLTARVS